MTLAVALGGNALLERGERPDAALQQLHVRRAAVALAPFADRGLVICHGNGPQVGMLALESDGDSALTRPYPLDSLVAETQGLIGYWLVQELHNAGVRRPVVAVVTQTVVDAGDPAFGAPTKFIGPGYTRVQAERLSAHHGWQVAPDTAAWRRVVASPEPRRIVELPVVAQLLASGAVVVVGGGGGVPVIEGPDGQLTGVEAVVDKDLVSARLALDLGADHLVLLTDVPALMRDFGTPQAAPIRRLALADIEPLHLPAGSMGPKVEACRRFTQATGHPSSMGALRELAAVVAGTAGTAVVAAAAGPGR